MFFFFIVEDVQLSFRKIDLIVSRPARKTTHFIFKLKIYLFSQDILILFTLKETHFVPIYLQNPLLYPSQISWRFNDQLGLMDGTNHPIFGLLVYRIQVIDPLYIMLNNFNIIKIAFHDHILITLGCNSSNKKKKLYLIDYLMYTISILQK